MPLKVGLSKESCTIGDQLEPSVYALRRICHGGKEIFIGTDIFSYFRNAGDYLSQVQCIAAEDFLRGRHISVTPAVAAGSPNSNTLVIVD